MIYDLAKMKVLKSSKKGKRTFPPKINVLNEVKTESPSKFEICRLELRQAMDLQKAKSSHESTTINN